MRDPSEENPAIPIAFHPAIVVVGYNRPQSLARLLEYLAMARYPTNDIRLIISVDFSGTDEGQSTREVAEAFQWQHGPKRLILRDENIGLRQHILECGDLSQEYGSVIVLEDDLSVGPEFYQFAVSALEFTSAQAAIGGVSLYDHRTNFVSRTPFEPVYDGYDNYYLQIASSWGQAWSSTQWMAFRQWYDELDRRSDEVPATEKIPASAAIPDAVANWPKASWLKYFIWFLAENDKYFLYPRHSHTTNHSDSGTHVGSSNQVWQVPLAMRCLDFRFGTVEQSLAVYDSFFEIKPEKLKQVVPTLSQYDFEVDLYGTKTRTDMNRPLVLTSRAAKASVVEFDLARKPFVASLFQPSRSSSASTFRLTKPDDIVGPSQLSLSRVSNLEYFYGSVPIRTVAKNLIKYYLQKRK